MAYAPAHREPDNRPSRRRVAMVVASLTASAMLIPAAADAGTAPALTAPTVASLSVHNGGTWGGDLVTLKGSGFGGTGGKTVRKVLFGSHPDDGMAVINSTTIQAY